jgi:hypothetical protein
VDLHSRLMKTIPYKISWIGSICSCHKTWSISNYQKFAMKTLDVVMTAMIIAMAKTIAITRGSNCTHAIHVKCHCVHL